MIRHAGWFDEPPRPTPTRPPLTPLQDNSDLELDPDLDLDLDDDILLEEPLSGGTHDELDLGDALELDEPLELDDPLEPDDDPPLTAPAPVGLAGLTTGARPETTENNIA